MEQTQANEASEPILDVKPPAESPDATTTVAPTETQVQPVPEAVLQEVTEPDESSSTPDLGPQLAPANQTADEAETVEPVAPTTEDKGTHRTKTKKNGKPIGLAALVVLVGICLAGAVVFVYLSTNK